MVLARFFAWLDRVLRAEHPGAARSGLLSPIDLPRTMSTARPAREPLAMAALLSVDGGGQFLLCGAERVTLGHLRAARADLGFLADVGALHAALVRADSLREGPGWRIEPCAEESVSVEGDPVPVLGRRLAVGERVRLGENLEFRLHLPDPTSASAVLELLHGAVCAGARHIVLLAPGAGGRLCIGAAPVHHVRVPGLEFGLELEWCGSELVVRSEQPLAGALQGAGGRLPFPPRARLALLCARPRGSRPPFGLSIEPVERP